MIRATVTYTDQLGPEADIQALLVKLAERLRQAAPPDQTVMVGAQRLTEFVVAGEGAWDSLSATVRVPAKLLPGFRDGVLGDLFVIADVHFAELYARRAIALSFELAAVSEENVVERLHRLAPTAETF
jgi:5-carboxymethyl-2-hydroxymuconate isomerase